MKISTDTAGLFAHIPQFITDEEGLKAMSLEVEYERLSRQLESSRMGSFEATEKNARAAYLSNPSDANLNKLKAAAVERSLFTANLAAHGVYFDAIKEARNRLVQNEIIPFARTIVERGLKVAEEQLARVTEAENNRYVATLGREVRPEESAIIDAARGPVRGFQTLLANLDNGTGILPSQLLPIFGYELSLPLPPPGEVPTRG